MSKEHPEDVYGREEQWVRTPGNLVKGRPAGYTPKDQASSTRVGNPDKFDRILLERIEIVARRKAALWQPHVPSRRFTIALAVVCVILAVIAASL